MTARSLRSLRSAAFLAGLLAVALTGCEDQNAASTKECSAGCIKTLAGGALRGPAEGAAKEVTFTLPKGVAAAPDGRVIIIDAVANQVRVLADDKVSTLAGSGERGYADGVAMQAKFAGPSGVAVGPDGAIYVSDQENHRIRMIKDGIVSTVAGGDAGYAEGPAVAARFSRPTGLAVAPDGRIFVADFGNHRLRQIKDGQVSTVVGSGAPGNALVADDPLRTELRNPHGVAVDANGSVYIADLGNQRVLRWQDKAITSVGGQAKDNKPVAGSKDGPFAEAGYNGPAAIAVTPKGVFISEWWGNRVRRIDGDKVTTILGIPPESPSDPRYTEGPLAVGKIKAPFGIAALPDGRLALADSDNHRVCVLDP